MTNWQSEPEEPEDPHGASTDDPAEELPVEWTMHQQRALLRAWECLATMHLPDANEYEDDYYPLLDEDGYVEESGAAPRDMGHSG